MNTQEIKPRHIVSLMKKFVATLNAKGMFGITPKSAFEEGGLSPSHYGMLGGPAGALEDLGLWFDECTSTGQRYFYLSKAERDSEKDEAANFEGQIDAWVKDYAASINEPTGNFDANEILYTLNLRTVELTAFVDFEALVEAKGGYRPTIDLKEGAKLANGYDWFQKWRGDDRRAFRRGSRLSPTQIR